jgi:hypothetical protein
MRIMGDKCRGFLSWPGGPGLDAADLVREIQIDVLLAENGALNHFDETHPLLRLGGTECIPVSI